jgi:hypothetical protein
MSTPLSLSTISTIKPKVAFVNLGSQLAQKAIEIIDAL